MTPTVFALLGTALFLAFALSCVMSAVLQILAWSRHSRPGVKVNLKALWKPEGYFDAIGMRQIRLAQRLLIVGGVAYLSLGLLVVAANVLAAR